MSADVVQAIARHTAAAVGMSDLDMIIYIADAIEPSRDFDGLDELRAAYAAAPKAANGKVDAGAAEGDSAAAEQAAASVEDEFGDVLFSLVNVGCRMGIDAENALRATCGKFRRRWSFMEGAAWAQGTTVEALAPEEREALWQQAKDRERA